MKSARCVHNCSWGPNSAPSTTVSSHGGPDYAEPFRIDEMVLARLETYQELAPLHQTNNLAPIRQAMELRPDMPQVACFDTAFHLGYPLVAGCYAIPRTLYDEEGAHYGFHGLSCEYVAERLRNVAPAHAAGRVIVAHLGSGASMCALGDRQSEESTTGFTALDGLPRARGRDRSTPAWFCT
jgi:acetate kinase